ncbi:MAG TPA: hypothetical protein VL126_03340, partial [Bacteroidota bacterium]|nr:hypothetical protein [Bacteroidota bacterium]
TYESPSERFVYAGVQSLNFMPRPSNPVGDSLAIRFTRLAGIIGFRQGLVDILFGYSRYDQHGTTQPAIFLSSTVSTELSVAGKPSNALLLPVLIAVDFMRAEASGYQRDDFNVASLGLGTGLTYRLRSPGWEFSTSATAAVQYSFEGFSSSSGSSIVVMGEAVLHLNDVIVAGGIVLGYRARYEQWSMSSDRDDDRAFWQGPFLGVLF